MCKSGDALALSDLARHSQFLVLPALVSAIADPVMQRVSKPGLDDSAMIPFVRRYRSKNPHSRPDHPRGGNHAVDG
jgi:hypothetical protein